MLIAGLADASPGLGAISLFIGTGVPGMIADVLCAPETVARPDRRFLLARAVMFGMAVSPTLGEAPVYLAGAKEFWAKLLLALMAVNPALVKFDAGGAGLDGSLWP